MGYTAWLVRASKRRYRLGKLIGDLLFGVMDLVNFSVSEEKKDIGGVLWRPGEGREITSPGKAGKETSIPAYFIELCSAVGREGGICSMPAGCSKAKEDKAKLNQVAI